MEKCERKTSFGRSKTWLRVRGLLQFFPCRQFKGKCLKFLCIVIMLRYNLAEGNFYVPLRWIIIPFFSCSIFLNFVVLHSWYENPWYFSFGYLASFSCPLFMKGNVYTSYEAMKAEDLRVYSYTCWAFNSSWSYCSYWGDEIGWCGRANWLSPILHVV